MGTSRKKPEPHQVMLGAIEENIKILAGQHLGGLELPLKHLHPSRHERMAGSIKSTLISNSQVSGTYLLYA